MSLKVLRHHGWLYPWSQPHQGTSQQARRATNGLSLAVGSVLGHDPEHADGEDSRHAQRHSDVGLRHEADAEHERGQASSERHEPVRTTPVDPRVREEVAASEQSNRERKILRHELIDDDEDWNKEALNPADKPTQGAEWAVRRNESYTEKASENDTGGEDDHHSKEPCQAESAPWKDLRERGNQHKESGRRYQDGIAALSRPDDLRLELGQGLRRRSRVCGSILPARADDCSRIAALAPDYSLLEVAPGRDRRPASGSESQLAVTRHA